MWHYHPNLLKANLMLDLQESHLWYFSFLFVFLGYNKQPLNLNLKIPLNILVTLKIFAKIVELTTTPFQTFIFVLILG